MKKLLALFLSIIMVIGLAACNISGDSSDDFGKQEYEGEMQEDTDDMQETEIKHTGKKIKGDIVAASLFSEGYAFVCTANESGKTFCINKDGYIVFELDMDLNFNGDIYSEFVNGLAIVNDHSIHGKMLCDIKGNTKKAEDFGVTDFSKAGFKGGYILVEKVTSTYDSTKKEIGVMNKDFEWVVEPSESIYQQINDEDLMSDPLIPSNFYFNDYCYLGTSKKYLNMKTGEVTDSVDIEIPTELWVTYTNNKYKDFEGNVKLDLSPKSNIMEGVNGDFINDKAPIGFHNQDSNTYFFTLVDTNGNFVFEPIEIKQLGGLSFDGKYILVKDNMFSTREIKCYDVTGKLIGEFNLGTFTDGKYYTCELSDGVIRINGGLNDLLHGGKYINYYYNPDFTPLF